MLGFVGEIARSCVPIMSEGVLDIVAGGKAPDMRGPIDEIDVVRETLLIIGAEGD
jgi:hypothetical protein